MFFFDHHLLSVTLQKQHESCEHFPPLLEGCADEVNLSAECLGSQQQGFPNSSVHTACLTVLLKMQILILQARVGVNWLLRNGSQGTLALWFRQHVKQGGPGRPCYRNSKHVTTQSTLKTWSFSPWVCKAPLPLPATLVLLVFVPALILLKDRVTPHT